MKSTNRFMLIILSGLLLVSPALHAESPADPGTSAPSFDHPIIFFTVLILISFIIGVFAILGGVGGGVIFTPLMLGFTDIDSIIIRTTGLFIALTGAMIAARPYLKKGISNMRLLCLSALPVSIFSVIGAIMAGYIDKTMGMTGEALIRGILGLLVLAIGILFICSKKKSEYPDVPVSDPFSKSLCLGMTYWEESLDKAVTYKLKRVLLGLGLFCFVGIISGLFGLGAGWAIVPVLNLGMAAPLKVSATCSTVMISMGSTAGVWPYILQGGMLPLFAVPCMIGMVTGAKVGTKLMLKAKPAFIRWIIIVVMFAAGLRLILKAISMLNGG